MKQHPLTLKQLRYLVALEETKHYRRAAENCDISQPSLSAQIQNIEEALGVPLVERSRSGVALTPTGREVAERARRVLDEVQGIVDLAAGAQHGLIGTIRLGAKPTLGPYLLPHVVASLHRQHPELRLYVREGAPRELEHELRRGVHDVILAQLPVVGSELVTQRLFREPLYLALAADHPLAQKATIEPIDLEGLQVLSLGPQYHLHDQVNAVCQEFRATVLRDYEGTSLDALRQMVGMGMGVTFLPALYVRSEITSRSEIVVRQLSGKSIARSLGLVWRKSAGRATAYQQIANIIREVAAKKFKDLIIDG
ncbi:MAG: hydrogen peroxide-inducible genes activator [Candidatus Zixiibacteriota bacterium]|nr:MAG: hydrogen peroxide-inducible genes activator [candidate division Zixibacteria bacterium]